MTGRRCFGCPEDPGFDFIWPVPEARFFHFVLGLAECYAVPCGSVVLPKPGRVDTAEGFALAFAVACLVKHGATTCAVQQSYCRNEQCCKESYYVYPFLKAAGIEPTQESACSIRFGEPEPEQTVLMEVDSRRLCIPCVFDESKWVPNMHRLIGLGDIKVFGHGAPSQEFCRDQFLGRIFCKASWEDTLYGKSRKNIYHPVLDLEQGMLYERMPELKELPMFFEHGTEEDHDMQIFDTPWGVCKDLQDMYNHVKVKHGYNEADRLLNIGTLKETFRASSRISIKNSGP
jgi:hypothetical protein